MSKRPEVVLSDREMADIRRLAELKSVTVGEWVRRALRDALAERPERAPQSKLKAVRKALKYSFPTGDMRQVRSEIESGYEG